MIRGSFIESVFPALKKVCANNGQKQQDRKTEAERNDLNRAVTTTPRDVRQSVAPRDADSRTKIVPSWRRGRAPPGTAP